MTARERLVAGCDTLMWTGRWALDPQINASVLANHAGAFKYQQFHSAAEQPCGLARMILVRSPRALQSSDAATQYAVRRLRGVRSRMWLMIGTSVDFLLVRDLCSEFRFASRWSYKAAQRTSLHPERLQIEVCALAAPLSLNIVYLGYKGLTALDVQSNASLQPHRFREIAALLHHANASWHAVPDFVSFGGIEWDFKQWAQKKSVPATDSEWAAVHDVIQGQVDAAKRAWPQLRGVFLRTQFATSYRWYRNWVDVDGRRYAQYNQLLRGIARRSSLRAVDISAQLKSRDWAKAARCSNLSSTATTTAAAANAAVSVLDLARMMNCTHEQPVTSSVGASQAVWASCGPETGWTVDGLHPKVWVVRAFLSLALNALADVGEASRSEVCAVHETNVL